MERKRGRIARRAPERGRPGRLARTRVAAGRLQVHERIGTDPYIGVSGRNGERVDASDFLRIANTAALRVEIREMSANEPAPDPGLRIVDIMQAGRHLELMVAIERAGRGAVRWVIRVAAARHAGSAIR